MKLARNPRFILLFLSLLVGSIAWSQRKPRIKGNRNTVQVSESLPEFRRVLLDEEFEVRLERGEAEGYHLNIDDNLVDILNFDVSADGTLVISSFYSITGSKSQEITVYFRELEGVEVRSGNLVSETQFTAHDLDLVVGGAARLRMDVQASYCTVTLRENSRADLNIAADSLAITATDHVDAVVHATGPSLSASLTGNASLTLEGISEEAGLRVRDGSSLKAEKFIADRLRTDAADATTARINAGTSLQLDAAGQTRVYLYGNPAISIGMFSDRAELHKEPE